MLSSPIAIFTLTSPTAINDTPPADHLLHAPLLAPIGNQEVWASGVTYYSSKRARIAESKDAGGGDFYDRVYTAERPRTLLQSGRPQSRRPRQPGQKSAATPTGRSPNPELTLLINPRGEIIGYTIGNDISSRDIEGANPLYLPQAKVYDRRLCPRPRPPHPQRTDACRYPRIQLDILRSQQITFSATTTLAELKRDPATLVEFLFRDQSFPHGCFLLTGTGHRSSRLVHAGKSRRDPDHHRRNRHPYQHRRIT